VEDCGTFWNVGEGVGARRERVHGGRVAVTNMVRLPLFSVRAEVGGWRRGSPLACDCYFNGGWGRGTRKILDFVRIGIRCVRRPITSSISGILSRRLISLESPHRRGRILKFASGLGECTKVAQWDRS
jgi:hypothetical protein